MELLQIIIMGAVLSAQVVLLLVRRPVCEQHKMLVSILKRVEERLDRLCERR